MKMMKKGRAFSPSPSFWAKPTGLDFCLVLGAYLEMQDGGGLRVAEKTGFSDCFCDERTDAVNHVLAYFPLEAVGYALEHLVVDVGI